MERSRRGVASHDRTLAVVSALRRRCVRDSTKRVSILVLVFRDRSKGHLYAKNRPQCRHLLQQLYVPAAPACGRRCEASGDMTLEKLQAVQAEAGLPASPLAVTRLEASCQLYTNIDPCISAFRRV
jgi:hypothetical protein